MRTLEDFKKDELITMSSGEYSSYCVNGLFRVLEGFNPEEKLSLWVKETGRIQQSSGAVCSWENEGNDRVDFIGWLNKNRLIEDVDYRELHTGSYGVTELS